MYTPPICITIRLPFVWAILFTEVLGTGEHFPNQVTDAGCPSKLHPRCMLAKDLVKLRPSVEARVQHMLHAWGRCVRYVICCRFHLWSCVGTRCSHAPKSPEAPLAFKQYNIHFLTLRMYQNQDIHHSDVAQRPRNLSECFDCLSS